MQPTATTWLLSAMICIAISAGHLLDDQADHSAEWQQSSSLQDAQRRAQIEQRAEKAAQALCAQHHGPQALATWAPDGALVCQPKRGPA